MAVKKAVRKKVLKRAVEPKVRAVKKASKTSAEDLMAEQLSTEIPKYTFEREYLGIPGRRFRFDFANTALMLAIEIQGGVFTYGGHSTGMGITRDCEKLALSNLAGWTVFQVTSGQVRSKEGIGWVKEWAAKWET